MDEREYKTLFTVLKSGREDGLIIESDNGIMHGENSVAEILDDFETRISNLESDEHTFYFEFKDGTGISTKSLPINIIITKVALVISSNTEFSGNISGYITDDRANLCQLTENASFNNKVISEEKFLKSNVASKVTIKENDLENNVANVIGADGFIFIKYIILK